MPSDLPRSPTHPEPAGAMASSDRSTAELAAPTIGGTPGRDALSRWPSLIVTLVVGALAGLWLWQSWQSSKADQIVQLRSVAELAEKATNSYLLQLQAGLGSLAAELVDEGGLQDLVVGQRLLVGFKTQHTELIGVHLIGLDGQFIASSSTPRLTGLPTLAGQRDLSAEVPTLDPNRPLVLARPLYGPVTKRWVLPLRHPVRDRSGRVLGFIVASAPVEMLQHFWSQAPIVGTISVSLLGDDGYLRSRYPIPPGVVDTQVYGTLRTGPVVRHLRDNRFPASGYVEGDNPLAGQPYGSAFARLEHFPATLIAGMPLAEFRRVWWERHRFGFALMLLFAVAGIWTFRTLRRRELVWARQQMRTEAELRRSEAFLEKAGDAASVGGWMLDLRTRQVEWTRQTRRIHEVPEAFVPTLDNALAFYPEAARETIAALVQRATDDGSAWDVELPLKTYTGRDIWIRAQGQAESEGGRRVRLFGAFQDVTDYRRRRLALQEQTALRQQAEEHAQALDRLLRERNEMLDVMAHEIRQPLNNASAALQGAVSALASPQHQQAADRLTRAQSVLGGVMAHIDNTLAAAALLASTRRIHWEDTDLGVLLAVCIGDLPAEDAARVRIERESPTRTVALDTSLMRLALRNVLANAARYSPPGSPVLLRITDRDEPPALVIEVCDRGPGFAPALLPRLFDKGVRGAAGDGASGYGLGLYIVRQVMSLHGGSVEAENLPVPPGGARVRLTLPQVDPD